DLKPSNLLLDRADHIHITDFGLGRSLSGDRRSVGGTAGFMAPEQVDAAWGTISHRTDVYGLGAVLYTLLARRPPLPALTRPGSPLPPLDTLRGDIPASVIALCHRCPAGNPPPPPAWAADRAGTLRVLERASIGRAGHFLVDGCSAS